MESTPSLNSYLLLFVFFRILVFASATTDGGDLDALRSLQDSCTNWPPNWVGLDPCGSHWDGIECTGTRVTTISLASMGLSGHLPGDIDKLSELTELDLSYNTGLSGALPTAIGNLKKLTSLLLVGCGFTGPIPDSIGSLKKLMYLSLNCNGFTGSIPYSFGNLTNAVWLDLADNQLSGEIPVNPGLESLVNTKHFHFGKNKLTGNIPPELFNPSMKLIHVLFESNNFSGSIPDSITLVQTLLVLRLDQNYLTGSVPSNISNLTNLNQLYLANNFLTGALPNLSGMTHLGYLDMSNNSFESSPVPKWSNLPSLTTLMMESTNLTDEVPTSLFSLPSLQSVLLKKNMLSGGLYLGTGYSSQLKLIDMQRNGVTEFNQSQTLPPSISVILVGNPICRETGANTASYCTEPKPKSYLIPPSNCSPGACNSNQVSSPNCKCAYPYSGKMCFRGINFLDYGNSTYYISLQQSLLTFFLRNQLPVDSVSISDPIKVDYLQVSVQVFPSGVNSFNRSAISGIAYAFSSLYYQPPAEYFGPYYFIPSEYRFEGPGNKSNVGFIIGAIAGGCALLLLIVLAGVYAIWQKRRTERATENNPFASWDPHKSSGNIPQLKGARWFSFEELKKCTSNFSEANNIGAGGYGKVYRGTLQNGQLVAIKRAQQGSMQGGLEFKTEIELLSRIHHKNLVDLVGFCFDHGEQMLVYEYIPNGSLYDSLSGKSGIQLDWLRRLKVALGTARGLTYLHELANPPIIHRDIKTTNILLDENLNAKVADFGLCKLMGDDEKGCVSTQVKGTMGYLDPEYYMTQQLTEKSDVYGFGVVLVELITGRRPIEHGKYIVREVKTAMDKEKSLYNLAEFIDANMGLSDTLKGLQRVVDLAMACVEESGVDRPTMGEAVKEIENIMQKAGLNPNAESTSGSASYEGSVLHPYGNEFFEHSASYPPSKLEPK